MKTSDLKSFHYLENGDIDFSFFDTIRTEKKFSKDMKGKTLDNIKPFWFN